MITGLAVGILFAPRKGEETREKIKKGFESCQNRLENLFGKGEEELNELKDMLKDAEEPITSEARHKLLRLVEQMGRKNKFLDASDI